MKPLKITFIGGGSYQWTPVLFRDIAVNEHLQNVQFVLHDIDSERNGQLTDICKVLARKLKSSVQASSEISLEKALEGADAVILCISTGGLDAMEHDIEIPKQFGVFQPVGDSTGPGGISRTLRNIPVVTKIAKKMERLCPDAWLLNLTNPMDQIVRAIHQTTSIKVLGLCHEYKTFMSTVGNMLKLDCWEKEIAASIAGINHFAWVQKLTVKGQDGFAMLRDHMLEQQSEPADSGNTVNLTHSLSGNQVKFALFNVYGLIPYPGDRHLVEFFPYFLSKHTNYGEDFGVKLTSIHDRRVTMMDYYIERVAEWTGPGEDSVPSMPSDESLAPILAALIGNGPSTIQPVTLPNSGQVENLPLNSSVETLATFTGAQVFPHVSGSLPAGIQALVHKHCLIQDLSVEAAIEGDRGKALQAMLADPLNNSNSYCDIESMLDLLMEANSELLPQFYSTKSQFTANWAAASEASSAI